MTKVQGRITIRRRPNDGRPGTDAVYFSFIPSAGNIVLQKDGILRPSTLSSRLVKHDGETITDIRVQSFDGYTVYYKTVNTSGTNTWTYKPGDNIGLSSYAGTLQSVEFILERGGVVEAQTTVPVIKDGIDGKDAYYLDLDNEMQGIPCNSLGTPTQSGTLASTNSKVYRGASVDSGWTFSKEDSFCTSSIDASTGVVSVTAISADKASVKVIATKGGQSLSAVMSLYKVKSGVGGLSPIVYSLEISDSAINKDAAGNLTPGSITVYKNKTVGSVKSRTSDMTLTYQRIGQDANPITLSGQGGTIEGITSACTAIELKLKNGSTVLDSERVPIVKDGKNGNDSIRYWLNPPASSISMKNPESGNATPNPSLIPVYVLKQVGDSEPVELQIINGVNETEGLRVTYFFTRNNTAEEEKPLPILPIITVPTSTEYKNITIRLYKGDTIIDIKTIPFVLDGEQGPQGPPGSDGADGENGKDGLQGCIYRMTQWQAAKEYRNDSELTTDGLRYIDVVLIPNPALASKAEGYMCIQTHTSSSENAPGTSGGSTYWNPLNSFAPIFTPFLLADGAAITLLQSNQVIVLKEDGSTVNVALGGGKYPLWIGHSDPTKANFYVDDTGSAHMTDAEVVGKIIAGVADGQRVELQPDNKAMKIYDSGGDEVCSFEGNSYTNMSSLFSSASGAFTIKTRTTPGFGFMSGVTIGKGYADIVGNDLNVVSTSLEVVLSNTVQTPTPIEVSLSGYLETSYTVNNDYITDPDTGGMQTPIGPISPVMFKNATASLSVYVDTYSDTALTQLKGRVLMARYSAKSGGKTFTNVKAKTSVGGYHVLKLAIYMSVNGSGMSAGVKWGSAVSGKSDISGSYLSDFYVSRYFANGFCLGRSAANYIWAYNQGTSGMRFVMENGGYGVDVSNAGIKYRHHSGSWIKMPLLVYKGRCYCSGNSDNYYMAGQTSYDGNVPTLTRVREGYIRINFPETWRTALSPSENNLMVNVAGYGAVKGGTNPNKANVMLITNSYIDISISDDESPNDGGFLISVYYMA